MVRAILAGTKTQTRRVMKMQPDADGWVKTGELGESRGVAYIGNSTSGGICTRVPCPYGKPGDRLWVRETFFKRFDGLDDVSFAGYTADGPQETGPCAATASEAIMRGSLAKYPPIYMRRRDSRILLEITDVRVQRVQEISEEDARAEGVDAVPVHGHEAGPREAGEHWSTRVVFRGLWDSINAKRGHDWSVNPWVWCLTFKRIDPLPGKRLIPWDLTPAP